MKRQATNQQNEKTQSQKISYQQVNQLWEYRNLHLFWENCLSSNNQTKVIRGIFKNNAQDLVYKSTRITLENLPEYREIHKKAIQFYKNTKKIQDQSKYQKSYTSGKHIQQKYKDQNAYFKILRPYFKGRNFHEQVFIHNNFPYNQDQLHIFIMQALNILSIQSGQVFYIPTLDNIYFDGTSLNINCTSFDTIMFLKHKSKYLKAQNFKHLYPLLSGDASIFQNWNKMQNYLRQKIKVKAFFCMLFCFMTHRSPIEMIIQQSLSGQVSWESEQDIKIFMKKISEVNQKWQSLLQLPIIKECLKIFSKKIMNAHENLQFLDKEVYNYRKKQSKKEMMGTQQGGNLSQEEKEIYLLNLFKKVFVEEYQYGWKQLFNQKQLLNFIRWNVKQQQQQQQILEFKQKYNPQVNKNHLREFAKLQDKTQAAKVGFICLHKYFLLKQLFHKNITDPRERQQFANSLHFQTYVPTKIGLPLTYTLSHKQWFQVFFNEMKDYRQQVFISANQLKKMIQRQAQLIINGVKNCNLAYLKRIHYILQLKIRENTGQSGQKDHNYVIKQLQQSIRQKRPFQKQFQKLKAQIVSRFKNQILPRNSNNAQESTQQNSRQKYRSIVYQIFSFLSSLNKKSIKRYKSLPSLQKLSINKQQHKDYTNETKSQQIQANNKQIKSDNINYIKCLLYYYYEDQSSFYQLSSSMSNSQFSKFISMADELDLSQKDWTWLQQHQPQNLIIYSKFRQILQLQQVKQLFKITQQKKMKRCGSQISTSISSIIDNSQLTRSSSQPKLNYNKLQQTIKQIYHNEQYIKEQHENQKTMTQTQDKAISSIALKLQQRKKQDETQKKIPQNSDKTICTTSLI